MIFIIMKIYDFFDLELEKGKVVEGNIRIGKLKEVKTTKK